MDWKAGARGREKKAIMTEGVLTLLSSPSIIDKKWL